MSIRQRPSSEYADLLAGAPLFGGLDRVTLARLAAHFERVAVMLLAGLVAAVIWFYRPEGAERAAHAQPGALALQRALLGPPSRAERVSLLVATGLLLGFITQPLHGVDPAGSRCSRSRPSR